MTAFDPEEVKARLGIFRWLLKVHDSLEDLRQVRTVQLMMALALALALLSLISSIIILVSGGSSTAAVSLTILAACSVGAYLLGRSRYYDFGSLLLIASPIVFGYWAAFTQALGESKDAVFVTFSLAYILGSVLLGLRGLAALVLFSNLGLLLLAGQAPGLPLRVVVPQVGSLISMGVLLGISAAFRNSLEAWRMTALQAANRDLVEMKATLEERVEERTRSAEAVRREAEAMREQSEQAWLKTSMQAWRDSGLVQLNEVMRGEQETHTLAENVLAKLCQILDAQAGALYLASPSTSLESKTDERLRFAGGYAYLPGRGDPQEFTLGEGLVGRAGLDREPKLVNTGIASANAAAGAEKLPEGVRVRLGLGDLRPRQVLLQPFLYGERLAGVMELATIHEFSDTGLEFLESISESLGTAFHTAQTREQVNALLQKTQMQAEELQAREEELRAMNEELQAQAESIRRGRDEAFPRIEG